jgi:hypothetical protein
MMDQARRTIRGELARDHRYRADDLGRTGDARWRGLRNLLQ